MAGRVVSALCLLCGISLSSFGLGLLAAVLAMVYVYARTRDQVEGDEF